MENQQSKYYFKTNAAIEALFARWYAWSYLISPAAATMNLKERHLKAINLCQKLENLRSYSCTEILGGHFILSDIKIDII
jgi:hypothetical protein